MAAPRQLPIYCVRKDYKVLSLTFDAAWGNEDTQQLIDILGKYNVKATFFVVGGWADKYPESVKALHDAGHEVMSHSDSHAHFNSLSTDEIIAARVTGRARPGSIVLFHNAAIHTPEALPGIIEALLREGYQLVPVSRLILTGSYTIDHTGRQCPA